MKKVMTYGTFDILHYGHVTLLKRAKDMGDYLIVGLSTDEFNKEKGKKSYFSYQKRKVILDAIQYVNEIIPENSWEQKIDDIVNYDIDIFVIGEDWKGKFDYLKEYCEVVYLSRTEGVSTSLIKEELFRGEV